MNENTATTCKAVVAYDNLTEKGMVLWHHGEDLKGILDPTMDPGSESLESLGMEDAPHGISVWEGKYDWYSGVNAEGIDEGADFVGRGTFREPTDVEWQCIQRGSNPWNC